MYSGVNIFVICLYAGEFQVLLPFIGKANDVVGINLQERIFTTKIVFLHFIGKLKGCNSIVSRVSHGGGHFFSKKPPSKPMPPYGALLPPLKIVAPHLKNKPRH